MFPCHPGAWIEAIAIARASVQGVVLAIGHIGLSVAQRVAKGFLEKKGAEIRHGASFVL